MAARIQRRFQGGLTGIDNVRFICRVYDKPFEEVIDFVEDFYTWPLP